MTFLVGYLIFHLSGSFIFAGTAYLLRKSLMRDLKMDNQEFQIMTALTFCIWPIVVIVLILEEIAS